MKSPLLTARILWGALFASTLLYLLVLELVDLDAGADWQSLVYPLGFAGAATSVASLVVPRRLRLQGDNRSARSQESSYLTGLILGLALAESVAIFGLVLGFLGAPATVVVPFFVVCWLLMFLQLPTRAKASLD